LPSIFELHREADQMVFRGATPWPAARRFTRPSGGYPTRLDLAAHLNELSRVHGPLGEADVVVTWNKPMFTCRAGAVVMAEGYGSGGSGRRTRRTALARQQGGSAAGEGTQQWVYVLASQDWRLAKLGCTNDPRRRMAEHRKGAAPDGLPFLEVAWFPVPSVIHAKQLESIPWYRHHASLCPRGDGYNGIEWYQLPPDVLIGEVLELLDHDAETLTAMRAALSGRRRARAPA
jgi:hypothetical protein